MSGRPEMLNSRDWNISVHAVTSLLVFPLTAKFLCLLSTAEKFNRKIRRKKENIWPIQIAFVFQSKEYIYFLLTYVNFKTIFLNGLGYWSRCMVLS